MNIYTQLSPIWGISNLGFNSNGILINISNGKTYRDIAFNGSFYQFQNISTILIKNYETPLYYHKKKHNKYFEKYYNENLDKYYNVKKLSKFTRNTRNKKKSLIRQKGYDNKYMPIFEFFNDKYIYYDNIELIRFEDEEMLRYYYSDSIVESDITDYYDFF